MLNNLLILHCLLGLDQQTTHIQPNTSSQVVLQLGKGRSNFGDPAGDSQDYRHFSYSFDIEPTEMYFPFGHSDIRYYINFSNVTRHNKEVLQPYLVKEVLSSGKVRIAWQLKLSGSGLSEAIVPPDAYERQGTLGLLLMRRGLDPVIPKTGYSQVKVELSQRFPLAGYKMRDNHDDYLWYWWVDEIGNYSVPEEVPYAHADLPKSDVPYPISAVEQKFLETKSN